MIHKLWEQRNLWIAGLSFSGIITHLLLRYAFFSSDFYNQLPLYIILALGGTPLAVDLMKKALNKEFGSDLLAGISIITSVLLEEYLAGSIVVLMLSGGEALEAFAKDKASSVLAALAKRMPSIAHKLLENKIQDAPLDSISVGDTLLVYPHEVCPVDGVVIAGHGSMDESYLTGEPFSITKTIGATVISGAVNGEAALTIRATHRSVDSRYEKITRVMHESEQKKPQLRRLGDQLGAFYTPLAVLIAVAAWVISGDPLRFLAVLVVATPCPLLIAIPIAIIGAISLSAKRAIIVRNPAVLEQISQCTTAIFDKTGTLTYGEPKVTDISVAKEFTKNEVLRLVAGIERYSKHPLASAILKAAEQEKLPLPEASEVHEAPGKGLVGVVDGKNLQVTSRTKLAKENFNELHLIPEQQSGLECVILINTRYAGTLRFHDAPRSESKLLISHLGPQHHFSEVMIISGDREAEVKYLADEVGIKKIYAQQSPEDKLVLVRNETTKAKTLYVGDGINDAPAMMAATVGMAIGQNSDVTSEAAGVVILDNSLKRVDEFIHISTRMRNIALQSAIGGMLLSIGGMFFASFGYLSPVNGALLQEVIDVLAILNALRASVAPKILTDY